MREPSNKRTYVRRRLAVLVRYITNGGRESAGRLQDISEGGLFMATSTPIAIGEEIILYPDGLGRLNGKIVRKDDGGVAVEFDLSDVQKTYLAKRIDAAVSGTPYLKLMEKRAHRRLELKVESRAIAPTECLEFDCIIIDLSLSGALVRSQVKPPLGAEVRIGSLRGQVKRHWKEGFAIQFAQAAAA